MMPSSKPKTGSWTSWKTISKTSMIKLYTPEQITRRNEVVECQPSQNMADLNGQKELEGFIRLMASAIGTSADPDLHGFS